MNNKFQENLRKIRKDNNLSQEQLADELGVSRQAISKWESGVAYPEMDKIIQLCDKFNLNMDDLLHKDINEVKGEEETKKNINKYIEEFLKFITDSFNLFINMSFGSKIKLLIEELIIGLFLFFISSLFFNVAETLFERIFSFLTPRVKGYFIGVISSALVLAVFVVCLAIMAYTFKTRYLDYYREVKSDKKEDDGKDKKKETKKENVEVKPELKESKIVIRDPKHSEYRFINGILKVIAFFIKLFLAGFAFFLALALIGFGFCFIASFLFFKTGIFFLGLLSMSIACGLGTSVILLLILNFILNRKSDKKVLLIIFISSIALLGIGCGLTFNGSLKFNYINDDSIYKVHTTEHKMTDNLMVYNNFYGAIKYVESDIKNVKIEYKISKYCDLSENIDKNSHGIMAYVDCGTSPNVLKSYLKELNDKRIIRITNEIKDITVYASKDNIKKLKNNFNKYEAEVKENSNREDSYKAKINDLEKENNELRQELDSTKRELNKLTPSS